MMQPSAAVEHPDAWAPSRRPTLWDGFLAAACLVIAVGVLLSGDQAVAANRDPDLLGVALTAVAVGVLAVRRRYPTVVLAVSVAAVLALMAAGVAVGVTTLGPFIAAYTAVALGTRRDGRVAVGVLLAAAALTVLLDPVDLTWEGVLFLSVGLVLVLLVAEGSRVRRETYVAQVEIARREADLGRQQVGAERERAALAATRERLRITRDLHDVIGHSLSVMVVQAGAADRLLTDRPDQARESVQEIARTGRRSLAEMRVILGAMRDLDGDGERDSPRGDAPVPGGADEVAASPSDRAPALADVPALVERIDRAGLPVDVTVVGPVTQPPPGVQLAAYRVVQEALTNCLRHSGAAGAAVTITHRPDGLEVEVVDDGPSGQSTGRPTGAVPLVGGPGHGIVGMHERVAIHGGELSVGTRPGRGFRVRAWFPTTPVVAGRP